MRGSCRFGSDCRNEHPPRQSAFGSPSVLFSVLSHSLSRSPRLVHQQCTSKSIRHVYVRYNSTRLPLSLIPFSRDTMKSDLSSDKPLWPLSSYGPAKFEPNIVAGLDESMEELRVRAALALNAGNSNDYVSPVSFCLYL